MQFPRPNSLVFCCSEFMSRKERYERGQKITDRLFELQEHHAWTPEELNLALSAVDEPLSINLHMVGMYSESNYHIRSLSFIITFSSV